MTREQQVRLWDAINGVVAASGGNVGNTSIARQKAVVVTEKVVAEIEASAVSDARRECDEDEIEFQANGGLSGRQR